MNSIDNDITLDEAQKDRREYVKNIGIEYRYGCHEEKRADSCHLLGDFREAIEQNFPAAFELYRENCEKRKYPKSCFKYAKYLMAGRGCAVNFEKAAEPLAFACDAKESQACKLLGLLYWNSYVGGQPQSEKAAEMQRRSCEMGDGESCWMLSTWYMGSEAKFKRTAGDGLTMKGSLKRDMNKAIEYGSRACDLNIYQSCANLMRIYKIGDGVPKDPDKAKEYCDKATDIVEYMKSTTGSGLTA